MHVRLRALSLSQGCIVTTRDVHGTVVVDSETRSVCVLTEHTVVVIVCVVALHRGRCGGVAGLILLQMGTETLLRSAGGFSVPEISGSYMLIAYAIAAASSLSGSVPSFSHLIRRRYT